MKSIKKLTALVLALTLVLGMGVTCLLYTSGAADE